MESPKEILASNKMMDCKKLAHLVKLHLFNYNILLLEGIRYIYIVHNNFTLQTS